MAAATTSAATAFPFGPASRLGPGTTPPSRAPPPLSVDRSFGPGSAQRAGSSVAGSTPPPSAIPVVSGATSASTALPTDVCYGTRIGIRSCSEQRYVAAFPRNGGGAAADGFDLEVSGYHPFRLGDVGDRAAECPSEWVLLHFSARQHRGPARFGDEVCFAKELPATPGERRKDRFAFLALGPSAEGNTMEPTVERREATDGCKWTLVNADAPSSTEKLQADTALLLRGKYNECLALGRPLWEQGGAVGSEVGFRSPARSSGRRLACRGRDGRIPELRFRIVKAGLPFGPDRALPKPSSTPPPGLSDDPDAALGGRTLREQEQALLEDVLFCMLGVDGTHIRKVVGATPSAPSGARAPLPSIRFEADVPEGADASTVQFVRQVLPLCEHHAAVQQFVEVQGQYEYGAVNHALTAAIRELLKEFSVKVGQLESSLRAGSLTIAKLWYHVQPSMDTMALLHRVTSRVSGCVGGQVLNGVEEVMSRSSLTTAQDLCEHLLQQASRPYFETISKWIFEGRLDDPYGEFFVRESERARGDTRLSADFWHKHFVLEERSVPQFLESSREKILHAGKYLHVFYSAAPGKELQEPSSRGLLRYSRRQRDCAEAVDAAYRRASAALLGLFMGQQPDGLDLIGRMRSVKGFFFLGKADWFSQLMDTAGWELEQSAAEVPITRLEALLDLAIRASSAANDAYREDISCVMHSFRIEDACSRITRGHALPSEDIDDETASTRSAGGAGNPGGPSGTSATTVAPSGISTPAVPGGTSGASGPPAAGDTSGVRCFTLKYRTTWPLSIVFSNKVLLKYQMIFRHLLFCRYVERKLVEVWVEHQHTKGLGLEDSFSPTYSLRQRMLHFCRDYIYYACVEVLEPQSHRFLTSLGQAETIDEVLKSHDKFLDTCLREVLLTEREALYRGLSKVLQTCLSFASNLQRFCHNFNEQMEEGSAPTEIQKIDRARDKVVAYVQLLSQKSYSKMISKFKGYFENQLQAFLRQIRQESTSRYEHFLSNLATRLDYNEYYSSVLSGVSGVGVSQPSVGAAGDF